MGNIKAVAMATETDLISNTIKARSDQYAAILVEEK